LLPVRPWQAAVVFLTCAQLATLALAVGSGPQERGQRLFLGLLPCGAISGAAVLAPAPRLADLTELVENVRASGTPVELRMSGTGQRLSPALELSIYRVVQESLTNVVKHAPGARAAVDLTVSAQDVRIEVADYGGPPPDGAVSAGQDGRQGVRGTGHGIVGMRDGVFRHLVITGRSRLALYLARIPAGLSILLPLVAIAFAMVCLVTGYEGVPQPTSISEGGISVPAHLDQAQLQTWLVGHPGQAAQAFGPPPGPAGFRSGPVITSIYDQYAGDENGQLNPAVNEMVKIGLWLELDVGLGFMVGLGLGSLIGQRTVPIVLLVVLEIIVTPILAAHAIPYFLDGQRLVVVSPWTSSGPPA